MALWWKTPYVPYNVRPADVQGGGAGLGNLLITYRAVSDTLTLYVLIWYVYTTAMGLGRPLLWPVHGVRKRTPMLGHKLASRGGEASCDGKEKKCDETLWCRKTNRIGQTAHAWEIDPERLMARPWPHSGDGIQPEKTETAG